MPAMSDEPPVARVIHEHKGELFYLRALTFALLRGLPLEIRGKVFEEFDTECETARTVLLNSSASESVIESFEMYVEALNRLRVVRGPE